MGYRALLFCPDEKTARTVTQVLNELEFTVEACSEPFGAVKKLMGEHFDGVVVDCDNEQNATLLFKSARNSASNQTSLAVAVVEGQAGVAKAFRIGANLVLTKPINVEQAKGTLRVARGLLRKGEPIKPAAAPTAPIATTPVPRPAPKEAATGAAWGKPAPVVSSQPPGPLAPQDAPQRPAMAARTSDSATTAASSLQPAITKNPIAVPASATPPKPATPLSSAAPSFGSSAASAPAPARIPQSKATEPVAVTALDVEIPHESLIATTASEPSIAPVSDSTPAPNFTFGGANAQPEPQSGKSKKALIGVAAVVVIGAAVYFGWAQFHPGSNSQTSRPVIQPSVTKPQPAPAASSPAAAVSQPVSSIPAASVTSNSQPSEGQSTTSGSDQPSGSSDSVTEAPRTHTSKSPVEPTVSVSKTAAQPILVRNGKNAPAAKTTSSDAAAPPVTVASASPNAPLPDLIGNSTTTPAPVLQTLNVSQGVSQGLIIKRVQPNYPSAAMRLHLEGSVLLLATVGKTGNITAVKTLTGEPVLAQAAIDAVKQWKYKPYLLNGEPVEIQTQVTVNFKLPR